MAHRNPLQEQLLKAGLVKKSKLAEVNRQQAKQRQGKADSGSEPAIDGRRLQAERAERDRALAAERNAQLRAAEQQAQIRQIIDTHKLRRDGDLPYRFVDGDAIRELRVDLAQRNQLARGALVIVRHGDGHELLPRSAADMIYARDGATVVDHGRTSEPGDSVPNDPDAEFYARFEVPDDLVW